MNDTLIVWGQALMLNPAQVIIVGDIMSLEPILQD
jgi:hypothetical protein